jgi:hypothetical protein
MPEYSSSAESGAWMKLEAEKCTPYVLDGAGDCGGDGGGGESIGWGGAREEANFQGTPPPVRRRRSVGGAASEVDGGGEARRHAARRRRRRGLVLDAVVVVAVGGGRNLGDAFRIFCRYALCLDLFTLFCPLLAVAVRPGKVWSCARSLILLYYVWCGFLF